MSRLTIAVTGLNATDNPGPGVPVIRAIRDADPNCCIIGLGYDALDPGAYMEGIADHVYLMPYPSQGTSVTLERLTQIQAQTPIDVLIPTLDSELAGFLKLEPELRDLGIRTFLPSAESLRLRAKDHLGQLGERGVRVPKSINLTDAAAIARLDEQIRFPVMVKGQFYEASMAYSPMEVHGHFERLRAKWGLPIILQEYVAGVEYDVTVLGDGKGGVVGQVPMRKMQLTDKGKAWGGVTVADAALTDFVNTTMAALQWRGPCELEIMRAHEGGACHLIEINPRFPAWVYLCAGAGRNLPWATVQLALGNHVEPMPPPLPGVLFLRHSLDQVCQLSDYQALTTVGELHREPTAAAATQEVA
jgi:carbamoyl-phosphate synthase large subunit